MPCAPLPAPLISGIFGFRRQALQIGVRFLKFIRLHRYRLKLCLILIVCAMFRLGEPRPLRRPLGLSSPPHRYFLEQIGAGDLRPHRPQPSRRWFSAAGLDGQCLRRSRHRPVPRFNFRCRRPSRSIKEGLAMSHCSTNTRIFLLAMALWPCAPARAQQPIDVTPLAPRLEAD
jgi:hypothetical protein